MTMFGSQWLANAGSTYEIEQSIRFNYVDDPSLTIDYGSAGNRRTYTYSVWLKRSNFGSFNMGLFGSGVDTNNRLYLRMNTALQFVDVTGGEVPFNVKTNAVLRDCSSWYHVVLAVDTTDATASNRVKIYINGTLQTSLANTSYPSENLETRINSTDDHYISLINNSDGATEFDGYMAEINFIDGTQAAATAFGETNAKGQWVPIEFEGTYGSNGFYLKGQDSSALGDDSSGNGNDWTTSNLAANDQVSDSPTNSHCTWNPLTPWLVNMVLSNGNTAATCSERGNVGGTIAVTSGKWYWETKMVNANSGGSRHRAGIIDVDNYALTTESFYFSYSAYGWSFSEDGKKENNNTNATYGNTFNTANDVIGVALDMDNGAIYFSINDTWQNSATAAEIAAGTTTNAAFTGLSGRMVPAYGDFSGNAVGLFAEDVWAGTAPSGFKALNTDNLPAPATVDPSAYFQTTLYEGDGSTQSIDQDGNSTFSPNLVWIKNRDATDANALFDTVRGATEVLSSNVTTAEATNDDTLTAFESDGFAIGDDVIVNTNAESYVAWQWAEGATPGLDIIAYTGNGSNRTIAHNLGVKPGMFIVKARDRDDANWGVYHSAVGATKSLFLQSREAAFDSDEYFNDTEPTASVFTLGVNAQGNTDTKTYIAYVFAPVEGFSKFGSYIGNGNAYGPMVNLGFQPEFLLLKSTGDNKWIMKDTKRSPFNASSLSLVANNSDAELTGDSLIDINSNGFKLRTTGSGVNSNGVAYVYMAFAEHPFKTANAR